MAKTPKTITDKVTSAAVKLIKSIHNTKIGATEFSGGYSNERCDAILYDAVYSYVIETKISRQDFLNDCKKKCRNDDGVGRFRYYACPKGLISIDELPEKWGLIYVDVENPKSDAELIVGFGHVSWRDPITGETNWDLYYSNRSEIINQFIFPWSEKEHRFLYYLAKRYKQKNFMQNIIIDD
jgi:hypothetical protein